jgi:hypothetical protein
LMALLSMLLASLEVVISKGAASSGDFGCFDLNPNIDMMSAARA